MIDLTITMEGAEAVLADFRAYPKRVQTAAVRSLNRGINSARTVMVREIAKDTGLRSGDVTKALRLRLATAAQPEAALAASLKRIPVIQFRATGPEPSRGKGRGVKAKVSGSTRYPHAFIATMPTGHRGVFARRRTARLPIKELFGPSLGRVFAKYRPIGLARAVEAFKQNFTHELERETGRSAHA